MDDADLKQSAPTSPTWRTPRLWQLTLTLLGSASGDQILVIALLWFVLEEGNSPLALGAIVLCNRLPAVLTAPPTGYFLDRYPPNGLMALHNIVRALCVAAIPVLHWAELLTLPLLLGLAILLGVLSPLTDVGVRVILPRLVDTQHLATANGILSSGEQLSYILGPAVAGAAVAVFGGSTVLLATAGIFIMVSILAAKLPKLPRPARPQPTRKLSPASALGFGPLWRDPALRALMLVTVTYYFAYGPLEPALPLYSRDTLDAGAVGFGALWTAFGVGSLIGLLAVKPLGRLPPGIVNSCNAILWGLLLIPLTLTTDLTVAICFMFIAAIVWAPYVPIEVSVIQRTVDQSQHGAVFGARRSLLVASSPTGAFFGGLLLTSVSPSAVIGISAVTCIIAGIACLATRAVRKVPPVRVSARR